MSQFPKPPMHPFAKVHLGPANSLHEVGKLDAEPRIQDSEAVAWILKVEEQDGARSGAAIPCFMLDRVAKDERLSFLPGACFIGHP